MELKKFFDVWDKAHIASRLVSTGDNIVIDYYKKRLEEKLQVGFKIITDSFEEKFKLVSDVDCINFDKVVIFNKITHRKVEEMGWIVDTLVKVIIEVPDDFTSMDQIVDFTIGEIVNTLKTRYTFIEKS